jgi:hypothetical protein
MLIFIDIAVFKKIRHSTCNLNNFNINISVYDQCIDNANYYLTIQSYI